MKSCLSLLLGLGLGLGLAIPAWGASHDSLATALTLHASFDKDLTADYSRGSRDCLVRGSQGLQPAGFNEELQLAPTRGRHGGALHFTRKGKTWPLYKGTGILGYTATNWNATVSVWLRLDPDKDLEPGYCDPVQIVGDDGNKGFIFLEWSKDETPRFFRFAIRPLVHIWNPNKVSWADIPFDKRPMVQVERAPFSRDAWTHVVFTLDNVNPKETKPSGRLYLNGRKMGSIDNWDLTFGWKPDSADLVLGAAYVGYLDELAVFNRALKDAEISELYRLPEGIRSLKKP